MGNDMFNIVAAQSGLKQFLRVRHIVGMRILHLNKKLSQLCCTVLIV